MFGWQISERKSTEESRVAVELRKHYESLKAKNEQLVKEKNTLETQFKNVVG